MFCCMNKNTESIYENKDGEREIKKVQIPHIWKICVTYIKDNYIYKTFIKDTFDLNIVFMNTESMSRTVIMGK